MHLASARGAAELYYELSGFHVQIRQMALTRNCAVKAALRTCRAAEPKDDEEKPQAHVQR